MLDPVKRTAPFFGDDPRFRRFVLLLALATAVPMIAVPFTRGEYRDTTAMLSLASLLGFLGGPGHVSLTTWFYADPLARNHFLANPVRYVLAPLVLIVGTTLAYVVWQEREPTRWINFFFTVWLLWHYQRQNWGVHSFVTRVTSDEPASRLEGWILKTAVVGGVIGGIHSAEFGAGTAIAAYAPVAFRVGAAVTMTLPVLIGVAVATTPGLRSAPLRLCTLLVAAGFFLPVFLFDDPGNAVLTYGLAHGLQYAVFMTYVARASGLPGAAPGSPGRPGLMMLAACLLVVGAFLYKGNDYGLMQKWNLLPVFGLVLGVTMAHFVIDAGIWRLRDDFPRRYVGAAFPFLSRRKG